MPRILFFYCFLLVSLLIACNPGDSCEDIRCQNGGNCVGGKCECAPGFAGPLCETNEKCKTITCLNGGTCEKGNCFCPDGWEGKTCQARSTQVWTGKYSAKDSCKKAGRTFYDLSIEQSETDVLAIWINNFHGWRDLKGAMDSVAVTAKGITATIENQILLGANGKKLIVSGEGTLVQGEGVSLELKTAIQVDALKDSCWCTFTKTGEL
ncbi:MAG: hypothetical protein H6581_07140 [Bacteroidia bacterium]|nr:hypothetical protein [Bacteroidia bacterium]